MRRCMCIWCTSKYTGHLHTFAWILVCRHTSSLLTWSMSVCIKQPHPVARHSDSATSSRSIAVSTWRIFGDLSAARTLFSYRIWENGQHSLYKFVSVCILFCTDYLWWYTRTLLDKSHPFRNTEYIPIRSNMSQYDSICNEQGYIAVFEWDVWR